MKCYGKKLLHHHAEAAFNHNVKVYIKQTLVQAESNEAFLMLCSGINVSS